MIHYYIIKDGVVIAEGACQDDQIKNVDLLGGELVYETDLPRASLALDTSALMKRQALLEASDWTDTVSAPARLGQALYQSWQTYRQELRDVTNQPGYPNNIVWPTPPQ
jgi:hypothetical protein